MPATVAPAESGTRHWRNGTPPQTSLLARVGASDSARALGYASLRQMVSLKCCSAAFVLAVGTFRGSSWARHVAAGTPLLASAMQYASVKSHVLPMNPLQHIGLDR